MASYTRPRTPEEEAAAIERSKTSRDNQRKASLKIARKRSDRVSSNEPSIRERIRENKLPLNLSFININEVGLEATSDIPNQVMVMYRNGEFEVLPKGVNGDRIKEYIGFKYTRITYWCMLHMPNSKGHFIDLSQPIHKLLKKPRDIFNS
jgi:hypothetical protein